MKEDLEKLIKEWDGEIAGWDEAVREMKDSEIVERCRARAHEIWRCKVVLQKILDKY